MDACDWFDKSFVKNISLQKALICESLSFTCIQILEKDSMWSLPVIKLLVDIDFVLKLVLDYTRTKKCPHVYIIIDVLLFGKF